MKINLRFPFLFLVAIFGISCLWDNDTIEMERQKFPEVYDLLTGNFLRHSEDYYKWRIQDRTEKLKSDPKNPHLYDDLAVAYSKLNQDKKAIEIMKEKEKITPGLYETYANMGTFYLHDGQLEKGIQYIEKAIEINPEAHFGREVYQKYLAEYLLEKGYKKGGQLPISSMMNVRKKEDDFYSFLQKKMKKNENEHLSLEQLNAAIKGVSGMMKFGNHNSPILFEALGDLFFFGGTNFRRTEAFRNLAIIAYTRAKSNVTSEEAKKKYQNIIHFVSELVSPGKVKKLMKQLENDVSRANSHFNDIQVNEILWIEKGLDLDEEFSIKYYGKQRNQIEKPKKEIPEEKLKEEDFEKTTSTGEIFINWFIGILLLGFLVVMTYIIWKNMNK